jgi:hypothetical protein
MVKRMRRVLLLFAVCTLSLVAQTIVLNHATVIDGTGAAPLSDAAIVIARGRITAI